MKKDSTCKRRFGETQISISFCTTAESMAMAEGRLQRTEDRENRADVRGQRSEGGYMTEGSA
jgi:hypothetical protein